MGTRSTVKFYDDFDQVETKEPVLCVYQQFDGYISGVGHTLAVFLISKTLTNGIGDETMEDGFANGMGCLAAQYVAKFKTRIGGFYLTTKDDEQGCNYEVRFKNGNFNIKVENFEGTPEELLIYKED